jgi:hypothetical protein
VFTGAITGTGTGAFTGAITGEGTGETPGAGEGAGPAEGILSGLDGVPLGRCKGAGVEGSDVAGITGTVCGAATSRLS